MKRPNQRRNYTRTREGLLAPFCICALRGITVGAVHGWDYIVDFDVETDSMLSCCDWAPWDGWISGPSAADDQTKLGMLGSVDLLLIKDAAEWAAVVMAVYGDRMEVHTLMVLTGRCLLLAGKCCSVCGLVRFSALKPAGGGHRTLDLGRAARTFDWMVLVPATGRTRLRALFEVTSPVAAGSNR
ncbi:hypothetical protein ACLOJK_035184, partial [Asimina triloba]